MILLCLIIGIILIGLWFYIWNYNQEGYNTLGALGPYKEELYKCLSICEREDPSTFLGRTKGSLFCEMKCYSDLSKKARNHIPPKHADTYGSCVDEVFGKCAQECAYSLSDNKQCMHDCALTLVPNCNMGSWTWK